MKSLLYATNNSTQTFISGGTTLNVGSVVRRYGNHINVSGGNIVVSGSGFYNIDALVTIQAGAAGVVQVTVNKGGVAIPGASASVTVADGDSATVTIPAMFREVCCNYDEITVTVDGIIGTTSNVSVRVSKE